MVIVRAKDAAKMNADEIKDKIKELKLELVRANVAVHRQTAKTKEIKRAISRLLTCSNVAERKNSGKGKMLSLSKEKLRNK